MSQEKIKKHSDLPRPLFGKWDMWLFSGLVVFAVVIYVCLNRTDPDAVLAEISADGRVRHIVNLSETGEFALAENPNVRFTVWNGEIAFTESDCPDKLCVRSGYISRIGQIAVCVPNRVSIRVVGAAKASDVDAIAK